MIPYIAASHALSLATLDPYKMLPTMAQGPELDHEQRTAGQTLSLGAHELDLMLSDQAVAVAVPEERRKNQQTRMP